MNKIQGEHTRPTNEPALCATCRLSMVVRGTRFGDDIIRCRAGFGIIRMKVTECSSYDDARLTELWRLEEKAWTWFSERFVSPAELRQIRKKEDEDE